MECTTGFFVAILIFFTENLGGWSPVGTLTPVQGVGMSLAELNNVCGKVTTAKKIVVEMPVPIDMWPWMVIIYGQGMCGGALISDWYILVAAHCLVDRKTKKTLSPSAVTIRFGHGPPHVKVNAAEIVLYPQNDQSFLKHDIALIRLPESMNFTKSVTPICLPTNKMKNDMEEMKSVVIAGWRKIAYGRNVTIDMRHFQLEVVKNPDCEKSYIFLNWTANPFQMCAGYRGGGWFACVGDLYGPLIVQNLNQWYAIGVISMESMYKCYEYGRPGIFFRITEYLDWIKTNAKLN